MDKKLYSVYEKLYSHFGPQYWWPADTAFEVAVGAILTQNTSWLNVEKAIKNLKKRNLLNFSKLHKLPRSRLASLIKPSGYYNIKASRLESFLDFLFNSCKGRLAIMEKRGLGDLRRQLLSVRGIGPETADSILLYAMKKPIFVVDAYTKRILSRHNFIKEDAAYEEIQNLFMKNLENDVQLFNEYHALLVKLGKDYCLKSKPKCDICPLKWKKSKVSSYQSQVF